MSTIRFASAANPRNHVYVSMATSLEGSATLYWPGPDIQN